MRDLWWIKKVSGMVTRKVSSAILTGVECQIRIEYNYVVTELNGLMHLSMPFKAEALMN